MAKTIVRRRCKVAIATTLACAMVLAPMAGTTALADTGSAGTYSATADTGVDGWWHYGQGGWWFEFPDGSYAADTWLKNNDKMYHFDSNGYMQTGWLNDHGHWFYLGSDGAMVEGWQNIGGTWYYFSFLGAYSDNLPSWYHVAGITVDRITECDICVMDTGWQYDGGAWYYLSDTGAMQTGWQKISGKWYYFGHSGAMQTGWLKYGGHWYYLFDKASYHDTERNLDLVYGEMLTGFYRIDGKLYFFCDEVFAGKPLGSMYVGQWMQCGGDPAAMLYFGDSGALENELPAGITSDWGVVINH